MTSMCAHDCLAAVYVCQMVQDTDKSVSNPKRRRDMTDVKSGSTRTYKALGRAGKWYGVRTSPTYERGSGFPCGQ